MQRIIMQDKYAEYQASRGRLDFVNLCINGAVIVSSYDAGGYLTYEDSLLLGGLPLPKQFAQACWVIGYPLDESGVLAEGCRHCIIIEPQFTGWRVV